MQNILINLYSQAALLLRKSLKDESGQDLVEYAAVIVIVVLGLTAGMGTLANGINNAMTSVGTAINQQIG